MNIYEKNTTHWLAIISGILLLVGLVLVLSSCSIAGTIPRPHESAAVSGNSASDGLATTVNRLAFIAGLAAIGAVAAGIALKQYATALVGGPALAGLALVFLLLPAIAAAVKWLLVGSVVLALGGAAWLAYSRWKAYVAVKLTATHADRMEAAETDIDVVVAKNVSHAEQVKAGVAQLIDNVRSITIN
jgi:hypothetical protein